MCQTCRQPADGFECEGCRIRRDELDSMKATGETLTVVAVLALLAVIMAVVIGA